MKGDEGRGNCSLATLRLLLFVGCALMVVIMLTWSLSGQMRICTFDMHMNPEVMSKSDLGHSWNYNWDRYIRIYRISNTRFLNCLQYGLMKYFPCLLSWFSRGHQSENTTSIPSRVIVLIRHGKYDFKTGLLTDLGNYGQSFSILVTFKVS